jgi:hypothetical protein
MLFDEQAELGDSSACSSNIELGDSSLSLSLATSETNFCLQKNAFSFSLIDPIVISFARDRYLIEFLRKSIGG